MPLQWLAPDKVVTPQGAMAFVTGTWVMEYLFLRRGGPFVSELPPDSDAPHRALCNVGNGLTDVVVLCYVIGALAKNVAPEIVAVFRAADTKMRTRMGWALGIAAVILLKNILSSSGNGCMTANAIPVAVGLGAWYAYMSHKFGPTVATRRWNQAKATVWQWVRTILQMGTAHVAEIAAENVAKLVSDAIHSMGDESQGGFRVEHRGSVVERVVRRLNDKAGIHDAVALRRAVKVTPGGGATEERKAIIEAIQCRGISRWWNANRDGYVSAEKATALVDAIATDGKPRPQPAPKGAPAARATAASGAPASVAPPPPPPRTAPPSNSGKIKTS